MTQKTILTFILGLTISLLAIPNVHAKEWRVAAVVNDDIISMVDVENRIDLGMLVSNIPDTPENRERMKRQALASLLDETVRMQEAKRLNITPSQAEINQAITMIAEQNDTDAASFVKGFAKQPEAFSSFKKQIATQVAWNNVVKQTLHPKINVSENDIDIALKDLNRNTGKTEYLVSEIFLDNTKQSSDKNQELADRLYDELQKGAPFPVLARQFSNSAGASNGGVIGWISENQLDKEIKNTVLAMPEGSISRPFSSERGIHIIGLQKKRIIQPINGAGEVELNIKQIFFPLTAETSAEQRKETFDRITDIQETVTSCSAMDDAMKQNANDMTGDLGWISKSGINPERTEIIANLGSEKLSEPLPMNDEGFVLLMVCGERTTETAPKIREMVANKIGNERLEKMQQRYLMDLKATAYIDVKL